MRHYGVTLYTGERFELEAYTMIEAAEKATVMAREMYPDRYDILSIEVILSN